MAGQELNPRQPRERWSFEPPAFFAPFAGIWTAVGEFKVKGMLAIHGLSFAEEMALWALYGLVFLLLPWFLVLGHQPEGRMPATAGSLKEVLNQPAFSNPMIRRFGRTILRVLLYIAGFVAGYWALS